MKNGDELYPKYRSYGTKAIDNALVYNALAPRGRHPIATGSEHCASNEETLVIVSLPD